MTPRAKKFVPYYRVSTQKQGKSGLGLEAQQMAVESFLTAYNGIAVATFKEVESGKVNDRPQLLKALLRCRQTGATLLIAKLDRLGRNAAFLLNLRDSGVKFICADMPEANELTIGVLAAVAQHEREMIAERTKAALQARKARGLPMGPKAIEAARIRKGQPVGNTNNLPASDGEHARKALMAQANERAQTFKDAIEDAQSQGHTTLQAIADHLNQLEMTTARGSTWTPIAVSRVLKRLAA